MTVEEQILARLRAARGRDRRLRADDRRIRDRWSREATVLPALLALWPLVAVASLASADRLDAALAAAAAYAAGTSLLRAGGLIQELHSGADVAAFAALPAPDTLMVRRALRRLARGSLPAAMVFLVAGWAAIPAESQGWQWLLLPTAAAMGGAMVFTGAIASAVLVPFRWLTAFGAALQIGVIASIYARDFLPRELPASVWFLIGLTPGGWIAQALRHAFGQSDATGLVWFAPALAVLAAVRALVVRLERRHVVHEIVFMPQGVHVARMEGESFDQLVLPGLAAVSEPPRVSAAAEPGTSPPSPPSPAAREAVAAMLDAGATRSPGLLDRIMWRLLTEREAVVAEWLLGKTPTWTGEWRALLVACALCALGSFVVAKGLIPLVALVIPLVLSVVLFGWAGFEPRPAGGQIGPLHAVYPIGFGEAARAMLKINTVRLLASFPTLVAGGGIAAMNAGLPPIEAWTLALKLWSMVLCTQPLVVVGAFMSGVSDRVGVRTIVAVPFVAAAAVTWLYSGFSLLVLERSGAAVVAIFAGTPLLALVAYRWIYDRGPVDLLRPPR